VTSNASVTTNRRYVTSNVSVTTNRRYVTSYVSVTTNRRYVTSNASVTTNQRYVTSNASVTTNRRYVTSNVSLYILIIYHDLILYSCCEYKLLPFVLYLHYCFYFADYQYRDPTNKPTAYNY